MSSLEGRKRLYTLLIPVFFLAIVIATGVAMAQVSKGTSGVGVSGTPKGKPVSPFDTPTPTDLPTNTSTATTTPLPGDIIINGSITTADSYQADRLVRSGSISTCTTPTSCPGVFVPNPPASIYYDTYTFANTSTGSVCVTVRLDDLGCQGHDIFSAAYLNSYDPTSLCTNYLADIGGTPPDNGSYSFNVPAGARFVVVVNEVYGGEGCALYNLRISGLPCTINFTDVHPGDYFYDAVQYLYCHQAISGYSDNTFRPFANTTRGQLSKIVVLAKGWTINTSGGPHFSDVPPTNPFYSYIETAYNNHIISGYADGTFKWGNNVTRAQLSKIVVLAQGWAADTHGGPHFIDVPVTDPFYIYIETAYNHGIISGYADRTFHPGNYATRGQISKIVYNAITGH